MNRATADTPGLDGGAKSAMVKTFPPFTEIAMLELGRTQTLTVTQIDSRGTWCAGDDLPVLLPRREHSATEVGAQLTLFVYAEEDGVLLATLQPPRAEVGEFALFPVSQITEHGTFVDWGIGKELLVPFSKQPERMLLGQAYLLKVCHDRAGRPFGNGRIDQCLDSSPPQLKAGSKVELLLWQFTDLGAKMIVNHRYSGLLYRDELAGDARPGDRFSGYVKQLRADGKLDLTLQPVGVDAAEAARSALLAALARHGLLPLHDQSPPEQIQQLLGLSKKAFKKALGGLYRAGTVVITPEGIRLKKP